MLVKRDQATDPLPRIGELLLRAAADNEMEAMWNGVGVPSRVTGNGRKRVYLIARAVYRG